MVQLNSPEMPDQCSIRVVSHLTGLSPETLRIWERRYGYPQPARTPSGRRLYHHADVAKLQLITRALAAGYRPHEVVASDEATLRRLVGEPQAGGTVSVAAVLTALKNEDAAGMEALLRQAASVMGAKRFLTDLADPLLVDVGKAWAEGTLDIRHEHLISEVLDAQIHLLQAQQERGGEGPRVLLATLPEELHGLGLEMIALYLLLLGAQPQVLGPNLPAAQIVKAAKALEVDVVGISVSAAADPQAVGAGLQAMLPELPRRVEIWLGGAGADHVPLPADGVRTIRDWLQLEQACRSVAARRL